MQGNLDCDQKTDEELVASSLGDSRWFFCLATRYEEKLSRYIRRISGGSKEDIEDTMQEVFIKTYQHLSSFDPRLKFSSWIYRIAHNEAVSAVRKKAVRPTVYLEGEDMQKFADSIDIEKEVDTGFDQDRIRQVLAQMDERYSEVLALRYLEEKDYVEIADILRKPISTVGNLISRGKKIFKVEYEHLAKTAHHGI